MMIVYVLILVFLVLEGFVRLYRYLRYTEGFKSSYSEAKPKSLSFQSHPYILYVKGTNNEGLYPSNSMGYGGKREFSKIKPIDGVRIYCVGGSTVEGHDVTGGPDTSWPGKLQDILLKKFSNKMIECINAAAGGYTTAESLIEFLLRGIDLKPDILLVYHNVNDAWTAQMVEGFKTDYSHARLHKKWKVPWLYFIPQIPYFASYQTLRGWVVNRFAKANALLYWISNPPWQATMNFKKEAVETFRRNIIHLILTSKGWGCIPVLIKWECDWTAKDWHVPPHLVGEKDKVRTMYHRYLAANNETLKAIASEFSCPYFDLTSFEPYHFSDTVHFSSQGLDEMSRRIAKQLEPIVSSILELKNGKTERPFYQEQKEGQRENIT